MRNLKEIGSRYNELQDAIDSGRASLRGCRDAALRKRLKGELRDSRAALRDFRRTLGPEEMEAYRDYRAIRREIRRCEMLRRYDKAESRVFHVINPAYIYMLPAAFHAVFFTLMPFLFMLVGAFFKLDLVDIRNSRFVGWWNFKMVFTRDDEFWRAFVNTILFAVVTVFLLMIITVLMSSWLAQNTKIHNLAQTMIFTPHISSMVAVGILWVLMLDPQGIINQFLGLFGIQGPNWLMDSRTSLFSVALVTVWKSIGYYCLIIIAGLQSLPKDVYEAALLDKGELKVPGNYALGEINGTYSRAAICQWDKLHYLVVNTSQEGSLWHRHKVSFFAKFIQDLGCKTAYALDGGQTTAIVMNDKLVTNPDFNNQRRISDIIYFATALPNGG